MDRVVAVTQRLTPVTLRLRAEWRRYVGLPLSGSVRWCARGPAADAADAKRYVDDEKLCGGWWGAPDVFEYVIVSCARLAVSVSAATYGSNRNVARATRTAVPTAASAVRIVN